MITTVNAQIVTAASMLVRLAHPADQSLHRALAKAEERLLTLPWNVESGILCIQSHSHPGDIHMTDGEICDCLTRRGVCWHIASWKILSTLAAAGIMPVAALPLPAGYAAVEADDYPEGFLDSLPEDAEIIDDDLCMIRVPMPAAPWTPARELMPDRGSDWEKAQDAADRLFAA